MEGEVKGGKATRGRKKKKKGGERANKTEENA